MQIKEKKLAYKKNYFEKKAWKDNLYICGIDEVGRGCLAGPLVVSATILPKNAKHKLLKDSKILNEKERSIAFNWLQQRCLHTSVIISNQQIDKLNIYQSTLLAMKKSFIQILEIIPFNIEQIKYLLIDAMPVSIDSVYKNENLKIISMNHGESISASIAAASIIAKVTRDNLMKKIGSIFPAFKLEKHKGYGTKNHLQNINQNGISIIHRKRFVKKIKGEMDEKQRNLF